MKKNYNVLSLGILITSSVCGQSILNTSGSSTVVNQMVHEWSIGELLSVYTYSTSSIIVTEGILQPVNLVTSIDESSLDQSLSMITVYPNPTMDFVNIQVEDGVSGKVVYTVRDLSGRVVQQQEADAQNGQNSIAVDFTQVVKGQYTLQIQFNKDGAAINKTYNIQKIR
jgi:hypothetical protein